VEVVPRKGRREGLHLQQANWRLSPLHSYLPVRLLRYHGENQPRAGFLKLRQGVQPFDDKQDSGANSSPLGDEDGTTVGETMCTVILTWRLKTSRPCCSTWPCSTPALTSTSHEFTVPHQKLINVEFGLGKEEPVEDWTEEGWIGRANQPWRTILTGATRM